MLCGNPSVELVNPQGVTLFRRYIKPEENTICARPDKFTFKIEDAQNRTVVAEVKVKIPRSCCANPTNTDSETNLRFLVNLNRADKALVAAAGFMLAQWGMSGAFPGFHGVPVVQ